MRRKSQAIGLGARPDFGAGLSSGVRRRYGTTLYRYGMRTTSSPVATLELKVSMYR